MVDSVIKRTRKFPILMEHDGNVFLFVDVDNCTQLSGTFSGPAWEKAKPSEFTRFLGELSLSNDDNHDFFQLKVDDLGAVWVVFHTGGAVVVHSGNSMYEVGCYVKRLPESSTLHDFEDTIELSNK